jgi:acetyl esterase/lipase
MPEAMRDWLGSLNNQRRALSIQGSRYTPTSVREAMDALTRHFVTDVPEIPVVLDDLVPGPRYRVPVRIYHPRPPTALPVVVFAHGGGHVSGSVSIYDPIARKLARATDRILVSVDFRLAPECPYPAALTDVLATVKAVFPLLDDLGVSHRPRLGLIGDSGGGALCATVAHLSQFEPGVSIERQALIYPSVDYTLSCPSVTDKGQGYLLERERILWMFDCYLQNAENRRNVSPLFMAITPRYPETLVITAGHCPLRDEGVAYAKRLSEEGINCARESLPGMVHAYLNLEDLAAQECRWTYERLGRFFGGGGTAAA